MPIIAFTASRQSWLLQKLEDEGVDGYWSKERPGEGVSDLYSASQAAELLDQIREAVSRRERYAFLSLSPAKPNGKGMASPDSNAHMRLLLLYEGRCDLADLFDRYRRDIRNRLDLIHGESLKTRASHATLEDVRGLVRVLRFALRG